MLMTINAIYHKFKILNNKIYHKFLFLENVYTTKYNYKVIISSKIINLFSKTYSVSLNYITTNIFITFKEFNSP